MHHFGFRFELFAKAQKLNLNFLITQAEWSYRISFKSHMGNKICDIQHSVLMTRMFVRSFTKLVITEIWHLKMQDNKQAQ